MRRWGCGSGDVSGNDPLRYIDGKQHACSILSGLDGVQGEEMETKNGEMAREKEKERDTYRLRLRQKNPERGDKLLRAC